MHKFRFLTTLIEDPYALLRKICIKSLLRSIANAQSSFVAEDEEASTELSSALSNYRLSSLARIFMLNLYSVCTS